MGELIAFDAKQMDLIQRTVAKDCNRAEFDTFMSICKVNGLNPLNREIYAFVFNKGKDSRQLTPVVAIDGLRKIAARTGDYRPDEQPPRIAFDDAAKCEKSNPKGITTCTVTVYKYAHGDWHPCPATVYWDEFVPLSKEGVIDWKKKLWREKPTVMISKVAEAQALRRAFPENFGNLYAEEEFDKSTIIDITPSEMAEQGAREQREQITNSKDAIFFQPLDGKTERVPLGQYYDRVMAFMQENKDEPSTVLAWRDVNKLFLTDFWAKDKSAALDLKQQIERFEKDMAEQRSAAPELELEAADG